jgi:hypothetical protein
VFVGSLRTASSKALDAILFVGINKEMLLGIGNIVEHETLGADVFEGLIKLELNRRMPFWTGENLGKRSE